MAGDAPVSHPAEWRLVRLAWISTDESLPNIVALRRGAQVVKRSARPFHQGTLTG
jgi:hypothetical protein